MAVLRPSQGGWVLGPGRKRLGLSPQTAFCHAWLLSTAGYGVLVHESFFRDQLTKKTESVVRPDVHDD